MTIIKAGTTSTTGFVVDTDASGTLILQSGGSNTAVAFDSQTQQAVFTQPISQPGSFMFRNKIINGNFDIWQRGASQTSSGYGSADRWACFNTGSTKTASRQTFTLGQTEVPTNPKYFFRHVVTSVAGAGNFVVAQQRIEGVGTLAGQTATLSFWAKADTNKNIAVEFLQRFGTGGSFSAEIDSIGSQLVALTSSWTKYTITVNIPSISGKTLGTDGNDFLQLTFWFDAGSTFDSRSASLGQQSGTFDIAQVQIEEGAVATPFEQRPIGLELSLCQRYFYRISVNGENVGSSSATTTSYNKAFLPVTMRASPTVTLNGTNTVTVNFFGVGSSTSTSFALSGNRSFILWNINTLSPARTAFIPTDVLTETNADAEL